MVKWNQERAERLSSNLVPVMLLAIFVVISVPIDTLTQGPSSPANQSLYWIADATSDLSVGLRQASADLVSEVRRLFLLVKAFVQAVRLFLGLVV
jgi:hypothetical protein